MTGVRFSMNVKGIEKVVANLKKFDLVSKAKLQEAVNRSAVAIHHGAVRNCTAVDTGHLRSSIAMMKFKEGLAAEVGTNVFYAPFIEYGTRPHFPPPSALELWVKRHFKLTTKKDIEAAAFLVARAISRRGLPARPFLFPAAEAEAPNFIENVKRVFA